MTCLLVLVSTLVLVAMPSGNVCLLCHVHEGIEGVFCPLIFLFVRPRPDEGTAQAVQHEDNDGCAK